MCVWGGGVRGRRLGRNNEIKGQRQKDENGHHGNTFPFSGAYFSLRVLEILCEDLFKHSCPHGSCYCHRVGW